MQISYKARGVVFPHPPGSGCLIDIPYSLSGPLSCEINTITIPVAIPLPTCHPICKPRPPVRIAR
jgi:hypothetical protein